MTDRRSLPRLPTIFLTLLAVALTLAPATTAVAQDGAVAALQRDTRVKELSAEIPVAGRTVTVSGAGLDLRVRPGSTGDRATLEATVEYWSDDDDWMSAVAERYAVETREVGDRVEFDFGEMPSRSSRGLLGRIFGGGELHWSIEAVVTVPTGTSVAVTNSYGPVEVHGVGGSLRVRNASGAVRVSDVLDLRIDGTYAEIEVEGATGSVEIGASSAPVTVRRVTGDVEATTSYALLTIEHVEGSVEANSSSGGVAIRDVDGDVHSRNSYASAEIEDVTGTVDHESSSGSVLIARIGGTVRAVGSYAEMEVSEAASADLRNGSGSVTASSIRGDVRIDNSYAPVRAREIEGELIVNSASAGVDARDIGGGVTITTSYDGVTVDGVGGAVVVRASSGRVRVSGFRGEALSANHSIETSYAGIEVAWPSDAEIGIEAECTYGSLASELGGEIEGGGSGARQRLVRESSSGAQMRLVATSGGITIRAR